MSFPRAVSSLRDNPFGNNPGKGPVMKRNTLAWIACGACAGTMLTVTIGRSMPAFAGTNAAQSEPYIYADAPVDGVAQRVRAIESILRASTLNTNREVEEFRMQEGSMLSIGGSGPAILHAVTVNNGEIELTDAANYQLGSYTARPTRNREDIVEFGGTNQSLLGMRVTLPIQVTAIRGRAGEATGSLVITRLNRR